MNLNNTEALPVSIWPTVWKYSIILAACSFAYTLIRYYTGLATSTGMGLLGLVIAIVILVVALKKYRSLNGGYMTFGAATLAAFMIDFLGSVISSAANAVYLAFVDKSILPAMTEITMTQLQQTPGLDKQTLEMITGIYKNFVFTPVGLFILGCVAGVIIGIILALILAAILKKNPPLTG